MTGRVGWRVTGSDLTASDFVGGVIPSGRIDFATFQGTGGIKISLKPDASAQRNESFTIILFNPKTGDVLGTLNTAAQTIVNVEVDNQNNTVAGTKYSDTIMGLGGNDILAGGLGSDLLTGGRGADRFDFKLIADSRAGTGRDVITDFDHAQHDRINVGRIDADSTVAGNQDFVFIGSDSFADYQALNPGTVGMLRLSGGVLRGNVNAGLAADFEIALPDVTRLTAGDFIL